MSPETYDSSSFSAPLLAPGIFTISYLSHFHRYVVVSQHGFNLHFPNG